MEVSPTDTSPRGWSALDWKLLAVLATIAIAIRGWQLTHTEVAARDSIGFIRMAWHLHEAPVTAWPNEIKNAEQHPLYPLSIVAVSRLLEPFHSGPTADLMRLSAQLASALAAILLVLPVYLLGRELFDRRVGFWSSLLLQLLPVSGTILADGMSESLFLLFASSALLWSVRALRPTGKPIAFALCGVFGGLAYLTRPEGAFIIVATGFMLLVGQAVTAWRRSKHAVVVSGAALALAGLAIAGPFVAITGRLTVKPSGERILKSVTDLPPAVEESARISGGPLFAVWWVNDMTPAERLWRGIGALFLQIVKGSFYVGCFFALYGLWVHRQKTRFEPGAWAMLLVCIGVGYALWRVVVVVGYLSDRHTMLILLCGSFWAVAGMIALGEEFARRFPRWSIGPPWLRAAALPLIFGLIAAPRSLDRLHDHRAGFRQAGFWLADHTLPVDGILDPLCWSHYYAGRVFVEDCHFEPPPGYRQRVFIVLDDAHNEHSRLLWYEEAKKLAAQGELVYRWNGRRHGKKAEVCVYMLQNYDGSLLDRR